MDANIVIFIVIFVGIVPCWNGALHFHHSYKFLRFRHFAQMFTLLPFRTNFNTFAISHKCYIFAMSYKFLHFRCLIWLFSNLNSLSNHLIQILKLCFLTDFYDFTITIFLNLCIQIPTILASYRNSYTLVILCKFVWSLTISIKFFRKLFTNYYFIFYLFIKKGS